MAQISRAFVHQNDFMTAVDRVARSLAPDIARVITTLDYDWTGQPAVFFMVIVSDGVAQSDRTREVMNRFETFIEEQIEPHLEWDVWPFFNVRTESEQAEIEQHPVA
jgi:hypothetical protein